jgi:hypothetical protein
MVDQHNELAKKFRQVRDHVERGGPSNFYIRLFGNRSKDSRMHNLPTCDEVAALIIGDENEIEKGRDIIVRNSSGLLERIYETHVSFMPLQYPLLFPFGEDGYHRNIKIRSENHGNVERKRKFVTMREFMAYRIQDRHAEYGNIVRSRRLFMQFAVDCFTMLETQRLSYIRNNQQTIRCGYLNGMHEAMTSGETNAQDIGRRVVLPPSFTGGRRYMFNNCQDAMAICKRFGYPDLFITVTCNPKWREIQDFLQIHGLKANERPDIICRIFKMKLDQLMDDLKNDELFGKVDAGTFLIFSKYFIFIV